LRERGYGLGFDRAVRRANFAVESVMRKGFERFYGVRMGGDVYPEDLGVDATDRVSYNPTSWIPLRRALKPIGPGPDDVFADLGSGKGKELIVASQFPFKRVVGVELSAELVRLARVNVERARRRLHARDIEVITRDVLEGEVPDDLTFVFLYCPFIGTVFERRWIASSPPTTGRPGRSTSPRPLHILYTYPWEHNRLLRTGRVVGEDVRPAQWPARPGWLKTGWVTVIYRVVGAGKSTAATAATPHPTARARALARWSAPNDQVFRLFRPNQETLVSGPS
jgi:hypothetical protein